VRVPSGASGSGAHRPAAGCSIGSSRHHRTGPGSGVHGDAQPQRQRAHT
jgi:hypothetical protein